MGSFVITLVLCSTFMHAGWNLLARRQRSEAAFFSRMLLVSVSLGFVPAVVSESLTRSLPPVAWACVLGSGLCGGLYYFFLARAYASSDFTVVYPVARSLPLLLIGLGDTLRGRPLAASGWLGLLLVAGGCLFAPLRSVRDLSPHRYLNRASLWVLLAAAWTVGYTLLDKVASEVVRQGPATAARYGYAFFSMSAVVYALLHRAFDRGGASAVSIGWIAPALAAGLNFGAYWLVLWAYQLSRHASYIVAFRQFSVVIGVVLAFLIYKEKGVAVRLFATFLLLCGLLLIGLQGR